MQKTKQNKTNKQKQTNKNKKNKKTPVNEGVFIPNFTPK